MSNLDERVGQEKSDDGRPPSSAAAASEAQVLVDELAKSSGVVVGPLETAEDLQEAAHMFAAVWETGSEQAPMSPDLLRALVHTGNYVAGARRAGELVGASVAFVGPADGVDATLHSHISAVSASAQGKSIGYALKLHQRAWSLARGLNEITWTFDPLVRRNAWFNLVKLGAKPSAYHVDFYGPMAGINGGDPSDRFVVRWPLLEFCRETAGRIPDEVDLERRSAAVVLAEGPDGIPVDGPDPGSAPIRLCQVPADIVIYRRIDPALARVWRLSLRAALTNLLAEGFVATGITRSGFYVLEREAPV